MNQGFLDTCAVLDLIRERRNVESIVSQFENMLISHVALGELLFGCNRAGNPPAEYARVASKLATIAVVTVTSHTPTIYGEIAAELENRGTRIPQNDIWIAAIAIDLDQPLISRDKHFARVPDLRWIDYDLS